MTRYLSKAVRTKGILVAGNSRIYVNGEGEKSKRSIEKKDSAWQHL